MRLLSVIIFCLTLYGTGAAAQIDCRVIATLNRLHAGVPVYDQAAQARDPASVLGSLQTDMRRIDGDNVEYALRDLRNERDRQALIRMADVTQQIARLAEAGDARGLRQLVQAPATGAVFDQATSVLARLSCPAAAGDAQNATAPANASASQGSDTDGGGFLSGPPFSVTQSIAMIVITMLLTAGTGYLYWRRQQHIELMRRRSRRFIINRRIAYLYRGENLQGRMLDISGLGAKVEHGGELENGEKTKLVLSLAGRPIEGVLIWTNSTCAGVQFSQPLRRSELQAFITQGRNDAARKTKTAPQGTPQSSL